MISDEPHSHGGMSVDFSMLTPEQKAKVESMMETNPAMQAMMGVMEGGGSDIAKEQEQRRDETLGEYNKELTTTSASYGVAEPMANALTPKVPVGPTVTPAQLGANVVNVGKNFLRAQPAAMAIAEPMANMLAGKFEGPGGYDPNVHGINLEIPGIDVGRIPYYFNRTMREGVVEPAIGVGKDIASGIGQGAQGMLNAITPSPARQNTQSSPDRMTQIVQQNPQLAGTPDVFLKAMQGPQANALNAR